MNGNTISGLAINCGKGIVLDIDLKKFSGEVDNYIYRYGLRQLLSDVHSAVKKAEDPDYKAKSRALVEKKLTSMYAGEFRANSERGERLDAIESEARRMALVKIQDQIRAAGKKLNAFTSNQYKAQVDKHFAKYMVEAEKIVNLRNTAPVEDDMLDGMI